MIPSKEKRRKNKNREEERLSTKNINQDGLDASITGTHT